MADTGPPPRTVIVTGASRGVGLAIARRLGQAGFRVVAVARRTTPELEDACAEKRAAGAIVFRPFDLLEIEAIAGFVRELRQEFGAPYGLVNNAAVGAHGLLANMRVSDIEKLLRLNVLSPVVLTRCVTRGMMTARGGRIVNIASIVAMTGYNGLSVYGASKAALVGFTRSLARELGQLDITVNAVAPGFLETEMTGSLAEADRERVARRSALRRLATPEDVAESVLFLLSDGARNVTGSVLTVDAGSTA